MKLNLKIAFSTLAIVLSAAASASSQTSDSLPSADDVVAKMMRADAERNKAYQRQEIFSRDGPTA